MLRRLRAGARFARRLPAFLASTLDADGARALIAAQLAQRDAIFLRMLERAVLARPTSLYARLCAHAGVTLADVARLLERDGLEGALVQLRAAGVWVSLEELKGRRPLRRGSLEIATRAEDFDNPLLAPAYTASSGGSRGAGTRVLVDLDLLAYEAAHQALFAERFDLGGCVAAQWRPVPPGIAGINNALRSARIGQPLMRWFSQSDPRQAEPADALLLRVLVHTARRHGGVIPAPEHVPVEDARAVARWLADVVAGGAVPLLDSTASGLVRVCAAARDARLDVTGARLRFGGEPLTEARAAVLADVGAIALARYSMAEVGVMGVACARPRAVDEVHLLSDKLAFVQHERAVGVDGRTVGALCLTTLLPASPKLLINAEIDDYGVLDEHRCGCPLETLGLVRHLHTIRSFDKLTSEGMSFLGADLLQLIEVVLPARFGGDATRWQLVEEERDGLAVVELRVHPDLGPVDDARVVATALEHLGRVSPAHRMMAEAWRQAGTLRVVRAAPIATAAAKILPLHVRSKPA
jgi:hypothetical protein